jgi:hypothetical protein
MLADYIYDELRADEAGNYEDALIRGCRIRDGKNVSTGDVSHINLLLIIDNQWRIEERGGSSHGRLTK